MELTLGAMFALKRIKIRISEDLTILAFLRTGYDWTAISDPPLVTVDFEIDEIRKRPLKPY